MLIQVMLDLMTTEDAVVTRYEFDTPCSVEEEKKIPIFSAVRFLNGRLQGLRITIFVMSFIGSRPLKRSLLCSNHAKMNDLWFVYKEDIVACSSVFYWFE